MQSLEVLQGPQRRQVHRLQVGPADVQEAKPLEVAPEDVGGGGAVTEAAAQDEVLQPSQVRGGTPDARGGEAVEAAEAQGLEAAPGGDEEQMVVVEVGDVMDKEVPQLGKGGGGGAVEPSAGDFAAPQLQRGEGGGDAVVGEVAEVQLGQGEVLEVGAAPAEGQQQPPGEEPLFGAGEEAAPQPQPAQAGPKVPPHQVPQGLEGDLGGEVGGVGERKGGSPWGGQGGVIFSPPHSHSGAISTQPPQPSGAIPPPPQPLPSVGSFSPSYRSNSLPSAPPSPPPAPDPARGGTIPTPVPRRGEAARTRYGLRSTRLQSIGSSASRCHRRQTLVCGVGGSGEVGSDQYRGPGGRRRRLVPLPVPGGVPPGRPQPVPQRQQLQDVQQHRVGQHRHLRARHLGGFTTKRKRQLASLTLPLPARCPVTSGSEAVAAVAE